MWLKRDDHATVITTDRLVVRRWRRDEAARFFDIYRRPEVVRWIGAGPMRDRDEAVAMIERNLSRRGSDSRFGSWAVVDRLTGIPVGSVILKPLPGGDGEVEIGWQLHPDSWGKGFATEAANAVLNQAFADGLPEGPTKSPRSNLTSLRFRLRTRGCLRRAAGSGPVRAQHAGEARR